MRLNWVEYLDRDVRTTAGCIRQLAEPEGKFNKTKQKVSAENTWPKKIRLEDKDTLSLWYGIVGMGRKDSGWLRE